MILFHRRFDQLAEVMSEADNGQCYQTEIEKLLKSQEAFIPFLGYFLTQVGISPVIVSVSKLLPELKLLCHPYSVGRPLKVSNN